jgi:4-diphosphocytidyl-2-C-methyl-D-erythritol kinase
LRVLGRRLDGYHELRGLMARLSWGDTVTVALSSPAQAGDRLVRPGEDALTYEGLSEGEADEAFSGPSNLALRAAAAYREATGFPEGPLSIHLVKRIPLSSGLGGGSSNAASVLAALERAAGSWGLGRERLSVLGASLGGDVPFFLHGSPLLIASGIGDRLIPFGGILPGEAVLLANPGRGLSTAAVFGRLGLTRGESSSKSLDAAAMGAAWLEAQDDSESSALGLNDLLRPALELDPGLDEARLMLEALEPAPLATGLSGSGPTFWGLYKAFEEAAAAAELLKAATARHRPGERWRFVAARFA